MSDNVSESRKLAKAEVNEAYRRRNISAVILSRNPSLITDEGERANFKMHRMSSNIAAIGWLAGLPLSVAYYRRGGANAAQIVGWANVLSSTVFSFVAKAHTNVHREMYDRYMKQYSLEALREIHDQELADNSTTPAGKL